jgi:hypothetical protein
MPEAEAASKVSTGNRFAVLQESVEVHDEGEKSGCVVNSVYSCSKDWYEACCDVTLNRMGAVCIVKGGGVTLMVTNPDQWRF